MKTCSKCKVEKGLIEYTKSKSQKDGLQSKCKSCAKEYREKYYKKNKYYSKEYYKKNINKIKQYQEENKYKINEWIKNNDKRTKQTSKRYRENNKENAKKWYKENKEYYKKYVDRNREKINLNQSKYAQEKRKTNPLFKLQCTLRGRTSKVFKTKGYKKNTKTQEMLGVSYEICKAHIERQFTKGMNWDNHGDWHIDHIIPLASAKTEEEIIKLCHYSNLQPLWAIDNLSKSDKIIGQQNKLRI